MTNKEALEALERMQLVIERNTDGGSYDDYDTVRAALEDNTTDRQSAAD